jgi:hypothetical protein
VGEIEITRVLEFEAALFEPLVIHPDASPEIIERHRAWLQPRSMDTSSGLMIFAFHSTVIPDPDRRLDTIPRRILQLPLRPPPLSRTTERAAEAGAGERRDRPSRIGVVL